MITTPLQNSAASGAMPATPAVGTREAVQPRVAKTSPGEQSPENGFDVKSVQEAATRVEKFVNSVGSDLSFSVDQQTGINVVTVLDRDTKEVIRQIPSREIIQIAQALDKVQGLLLKNQA